MDFLMMTARLMRVLTSGSGKNNMLPYQQQKLIFSTIQVSNLKLFLSYITYTLYYSAQYYLNGCRLLLPFRQFCKNISDQLYYVHYIIVHNNSMPFQYAQTHSPLANTDNRKHKRRVWLVRQYYFRAHCAPCARVKACRPASSECSISTVYMFLQVSINFTGNLQSVCKPQLEKSL